MHRVFVEKQTEFNSPAKELLHDLRENLALTNLEGVRVIQRYDIDGLSDEDFAKASQLILSEPQVETSSAELSIAADEVAFAVEYLPGQFDQRADSAAQCVTILTEKEAPIVVSARVIVLKGSISGDQLSAVKDYVINAVDSREATMEKPESLAQEVTTPADVEILEWFITSNDEELTAKRNELGLAMSAQDFIFTARYFRDEEGRNPSITEIKMLDTYWSDHCRHTTFATRLNEVAFEDGTEYVKQAYVKYQETREDVYGDKIDTRPECLMDIALMGMKELRKTGELDNVEISEEINAASIVIPVDVDGEEQEWLLMFKNETHNHPTEIEPFGGAATCLGGCIRDPLSGRSYVYQAMRVTGAADPRTPFADTMAGKLPQRKICKGAADGYSSYGNQIGLATGQVSEVYHPNYVAKRMEIGAVVAAAPKENVFRGSPANGDVILLIGGRTGRDGVGGATGSSKEHTDTALDNSAEVQKGNAPTERKVQRLFRNSELAKKIKVCNDFGAGGVSVAIGEIAPSLEINLDKVLKKYDGLDGTELAISESQERMAICVDPSTIEYFLAECDKENLECVKVADVTDSGRLVITWRDKKIVDFSRAFLDTNGVTLDAQVEVKAPSTETPLGKPIASVAAASGLKDKWITALSDLNSCGQKGLGEQFDSSVGAGTVLQPFGGKHQLTPTDAMVAKIPLIAGNTNTCSFMSWGFNPNIATWSPYHGALYAVTESVCRIVSAGGRLSDVRLTLQEYFEKLGTNPARWGKPFAALLGAFTAQNELRLGAIGGKDSMSGSFNEIDVPPTLVSFAVAPGKATLAVSPEFKEAGSELYLVTTPRNADLLPDFSKLKEIAELLHAANAAGSINAMHSLAEGGVAVGLAKMSFGNKLGATVELAEEALFSEGYFNFLVEVKAGATLPAELNAQKIGQTADSAALSVNGEALEIEALLAAWTGSLESTYPSNTEVAHNELETFSFNGEAAGKSAKLVSGAKPKVVVPCFPGTNSEYDSAKMFNEAGGDARIEVFRNLSPSHVEESLKALAQQINESQILMLPGGFSAGDEPDGSGKFIATVLRNPVVRDAVMDLIQNRDGLVLGICNGFQALIKTGLVPYGEIRDPQPGAPTLTFNDIGRHIACYATTRIASNKSPWLANTQVGDLHQVPFSHGEGKFYATEEEVKQLAANGQIATQYTDLAGNPSMDIRYNPNGSLYAIEGITSPCGRVLGKMGHTERRGEHVAKNIPGDKHQPLFRAGVEYFL
ncbi:phosphoribosylformylglycinamidine synthase [Rubritalea marina]|uniref:phosphoribosylformylglycinamidine synthase n=1 Tax=Rubritalea marina TaxID=361055 RepID=UPI0003823966|nr:phosphoribosylformylglycinamidine synthase [Rubritalea marina]